MALGSPKGRRHRAKGWRKRKRGFGAVAKHGGGYGRKSHGRHFNIYVAVSRDIGASTAHQYVASACVTKTGRARRHSGYYSRRCGLGAGRTPTAASKVALRDMAKHLR